MPNNPCATSPCAGLVRHEIESEIGHNGNRLLLKIAGIVLAMVLVPFLGGLFWLGYLHAEVTGNTRGVAENSSQIRVNELLARDVALKQSAVIQNLEGIKERLDEIKGALTLLQVPYSDGPRYLESWKPEERQR